LHFSIERETGQIGDGYEKGTNKGIFVGLKLFCFAPIIADSICTERLLIAYFFHIDNFMYF